MKTRTVLLILVVFSLSILHSTGVEAGRRVRVFGKDDTSQTKPNDVAKPAKDKLKPFTSMIKDKVVIEGLFTFYHDTTNNSMLMAITPEQIGPIYLCNQTRSQTASAFYDNASMGRSFPFYFKQVGKDLKIMEKNLLYRADSTSTLHKAITTGISDHLFASAKFSSKPDDSTGAILVNPTDFFVRDIENVGYFLGQQAKAGVSFDKKNSYFDQVKSFLENTEIDVKLHYKSTRPIPSITLQNPYSMFHTYHYSLSTLPETDYVPRLADDRMGHFLTMFQNYTDLDNETPYVRYVERWNLKKKNPDARISEPVEPIVYWIENTVPEEYRDAVAGGIEFWNPAFEEIGFRNAIVAKQMPDTADWDPADVRYNTVRWIVNPGASYAVGPSRANPVTGQIYDADIRVCVDFIRYMFLNVENFIAPVSFDGRMLDEEEAFGDDHFHTDDNYCNYGMEAAKEAAFGLTYLIGASDDLIDKDSLANEYIYAYLVQLVAHEVGHTLGLRHNFKASTIYSLDQINDRSFTTKNGTVGSIMDYAAPNLAGPDRVQGEFYASVPGPYDKWVIEYAYSDFGAETPEEELPRLRDVAGRSPDKNLVYATDYDAFGSSARSVDPFCNLFDLGDDPLAFCEHKIGLTRHLWEKSIKEFEKPGQNYQKLLRVFQTGWRSYRESARVAAKYIGGLHHNIHHIGDRGGKIPFEPVSAAEQRRAMKFLSDNIFAADAFDFPADLLNKLQPQRLPNFEGSHYGQADYPIHAYVLNTQNRAMAMLYSPFILGRLLNNQMRYAEGADRYTMYDMFSDTRKAVWGEIDSPTNINSFRRQLQLSHLGFMVNIFLGSSAIYPYDARSLAANDLDLLETTIRKNLKSSAINGITRVHFKEVLRQIEAARGAKRNFLTRTF